MNSGYYPIIESGLKKNQVQTKSEGLQAPFYFGGSQVSSSLDMLKGAGVSNLRDIVMDHRRVPMWEFERRHRTPVYSANSTGMGFRKKIFINLK